MHGQYHEMMEYTEQIQIVKKKHLEGKQFYQFYMLIFMFSFSSFISCTLKPVLNFNPKQTKTC